MNIENALIVLEALQGGSEILHEGRIYVWLDNHPTQVVNNVQFGIDGLAIKGRSYKSCVDPEKGADFYVGSDMSLNYFIDMCENISKERMDSIKVDVEVRRTLNTNWKRERLT